ncbi:MAG TPA: FAD-binding protein, partial [Blastocatellia bacterium]|nr:FAD-binding protein [Blastocatellia bacterium]
MGDNRPRQQWRNCIGNQSAFPLNIFRPTTLAEIVAIIKRAETENLRVRAVGSGHSFSDVALTDDFLIDTHGLKKVLPLDAEILKEGARRSTLVDVECGIRIVDLNEELDQRRLAL